MLAADSDAYAAGPPRSRLSLLPSALRSLEGPLSPPSLQERLESLQSQVFVVILSNYQDHASSYQHRIDLRDDIAALAEDIDAQLGEQGVAASHIKPMCDSIDLLGLLAKIHVELQGVDQLMDMGELESTADSIVEMRTAVSQLCGLSRRSDCPPEVIRAVKREVMARTSFLQQKLEELFASAFVFASHGETTEMKVSLRLLAAIGRNFFDSPMKPRDVLNAMARLGSLDSALKRFSARLVEYFVTPLITRQCRAEITISRNKMSAKVTLAPAVKELKTPSGTAAADSAIQVLENLLALAKFVQEDVFAMASPYAAGTDSPFEQFAAIWIPLLVREVLSTCLAPSIPDNKNDLSEFSGLLLSVESFDRSLKDSGYLPKDYDEFANFISKFHRHYAEKRRGELLSLVRDIIQSEDQNTVQVPGPLERGNIFAASSEVKTYGDDAAAAAGGKGAEGKDGLEMSDMSFKLQPCHVSTQAQTLVELAHTTLDEVDKDDKIGHIDAFYCARDIFDSYRAVMPVHHADVLENVPGRTMLFYNDCEYMAFHLLVLGYRYHKGQPYPLSQMGTFLDMVPTFRKLGEGYFRSQMRRQRDVLMAKMKEANGFADLTDDVRCETVEKAIKSTLYHLNGLAKAWRPIMPAELYLKSTGSVLDVVLRAALTDIAQLDTWTKAEAHQMRYLVSLLDAAEAHFHRATGVGKDRKVDKAPLPKYVTLWEAYRDVLVMLDTEAASADKVLARIHIALDLGADGGGSSRASPTFR
ncbi:Centromere/kinetochore protein zw10 [Geranomyces variabilis]|uniref:Centromere/kinetochore protein zw10 n=1 Tax=Geranomyces variabilis TaxID=109894 RepID=A0AAD5XS03_9FUNG|nr:Centromere/kinetochore protein zw10 [Geranomyces variabilis]